MRDRAARPSILVASATAMVALVVPAMPGLAQDQAAQSTESAQAEQAPGPRASTELDLSDAVAISGVATEDGAAAAGATVTAVLTDTDGTVLAEVETVASPDGSYELAFPASATDDVEVDELDGFRKLLAARVTVTAADGTVGPTTAQAVELAAPPATLTLENNFTSSVGWVKPGETYPFRLIVRNMRSAASSGVSVSVPAPDGVTFGDVSPLGAEAGSATVEDDGSISWELGTVPGGSVAAPTTRTLVVTATADTLAQDPQVSWKNLSTSATLRADGIQSVVESHGPKVIPPSGTYETARYGDRPFPVVPVAYTDLGYLDRNAGGDLAEIINDENFAGSTFNLFQEMSYGQLFPEGTVPSANIATADWDGFDTSRFHELDIPAESADVCFGTYTPGAAGTDAIPERIVNGVYQLPGSVEFYGSDSGIFGDETQRPENQGSIDQACGDIGKAVYDAAAIADPEIDYNEYDTDKDGIVDFFMMVFAGCGGNGPSQRDCDGSEYGNGSGYDAIWPHSSTLEGGFIDDETGLTGYVTDDRLTNLRGELLFYTDANRVETTTEETAFPAYVRVGPYNVNPEDSIDAASVISHEYGHSLGLPDYYSLSAIGADFYGTWNLMASDYSQHMDLNGRQELGWVVPKQVPDGDSEVSLVDSTVDTNEIQWQTPDGEPYTLSGPSVHNGDAYKAPLPRRILLDPDLVDNGASPTHVYWSQSGNDFGCVPAPTAHSLDVPLDALADVSPGADVELRFNTYFDIEWDFDYGFVLATTDDGASYTSVANNEGYTLPASENPNTVGCQDKFGNGLTGTSGAWEDGDGAPDRAAAEQTPGTQFLPTTWDLSDYAGEATTIRFAYNTDVGLARPGWFIDDIEVVVDGTVIYSNDLEDGPDEGVVNGGCDDDQAVQTGPCSDGWQYIEGGQESTADHAYLIEARDRTGFDFDARDQSDRGDIDWSPGISLGYTDEARGYGNTQATYRPNQHVLDANPVPYSEGTTFGQIFTPDLTDAAWTPESTPFSDFGDGWADNYAEVNEAGTALVDWTFQFDCLSMDVTSMTGQDVGPSGPPGNLAADVAFTRGDGCGGADYGFGNVTNAAPTAVAQTKDQTVRQGETVTFDASASADDLTPKAGLTYSWDLDGDGTEDATGEVVEYVYDELGEFEATLTVTDADGATGTDSLTITVVDDKDATIRVAGEERIATSIELSRLAFPDGADTAVLAQARDFPDALSAATLAGEANAPVLLNPTDGLDLRVATELERLGVSTVVVTGRQNALSDQVVEDVASLGIEVQRIGGADRQETAARIAEEITERGGEVETVVVARAYDFADALASGNVGIAGRAPILLTLQDELDAVTLETMQALDPDNVVVAGGTEAVSAAVFDAIADAGFEVERLGGATRIETALLLAERARELGASMEPTVLTNAFNYPDALGAAPAAAALGGQMLTVHPDGAVVQNTGVFDLLAANADEVDTVYVAGGTNAISGTLDAAVEARITTEDEAGLPESPPFDLRR